VELHQFLHESEADAGAFVAAPTRALDAVETLEQARRLGFRNARARIAHRENCVSRIADCGFSGPLLIHLPPRFLLFIPQSAMRNFTLISPSNVNLNAFESRFKTIFSHISRST